LKSQSLPTRMLICSSLALASQSTTSWAAYLAELYGVSSGLEIPGKGVESHEEETGPRLSPSF
jgi:hypothetical protein